MRINTRFTVAVHVLALIALDRTQPPASGRMALSTGSHPVVVRQIMSALKRAGLIETRSGVPGGRLAKPQEEISLLEIYRAVKQGTDAPLFDFHPGPNPVCPVGRNIRGAMERPLFDAQSAMENALGAYSLKDITDDILEKEMRRSS